MEREEAEWRMETKYFPGKLITGVISVPFAFCMFNEHKIVCAKQSIDKKYEFYEFGRRK